ncbi:MAG: transcriptional regulator GlxA family with amidase domain [Halioglobus sp.]|jgi:transcriptional regulator GlxA family with amidase domain
MTEATESALVDGPPAHIGFLMMPEYTLSPFANAVEVLRMANRQSGRQIYRWSILTLDGKPVVSSSNLEFVFDGAVSAVEPYDLLMVCGGYTIEKQCTPALLDLLRQLAKKKVPLGAMCTGTYALAAAGLLEGSRCTIHWENLASLREQFPRLLISSSLFVIDRNRYTCSGGISSIDLMLSVIGRFHGHPLVQEISEQFTCERIRTEVDLQRAPLQYLIGASQPKLVDAVAMMEANIEEPLSLDDVAAYVTISRRQLERLFDKYLHCSPSRYYLELRLYRARLLLVQTSMPIIEVAVSCGFSTAPHFSKCYSEYYGKPPRDERLTRT